jgi:2-polyprenyl-3-methyl-5-hydroxy-6-metoxy-1,4-benzoquinol methylase
MVSRDEVISAFRLILGREPESDTVIEANMGVTSLQDLRTRFIASAEFRSKIQSTVDIGSSNAVGRFRLSKPLKVEVTAPDKEFALLLERVQKSWSILGEEKPHWSVLTNTAYEPSSIDENIETFYRSGGQSMRLYLSAIERAFLHHRPKSACFELGCGVGRITEHLANTFEHVIAADVSAPHIALARERMDKLSIQNVDFRLLSQLTDLAEIQSYDTFFSLIVLQHNPPPVIYKMLDLIFQKLNPGGLAFFQVPVYCEGYSFAVKSYLSQDRALGMEMHLIPQKNLFEIMKKHNFDVLEVFEDMHTGLSFCSQTILAKKVA